MQAAVRCSAAASRSLAASSAAPPSADSMEIRLRAHFYLCHMLSRFMQQSPAPPLIYALEVVQPNKAFRARQWTLAGHTFDGACTWGA